MSREPLIKEWSRESQPQWDAAVEGNSALREAFLRILGEEVHSRLDVMCGHGLLDIQYCYD
eukprot:641603-Pyramimonas_sp.AAC.1